MDNEDEIYDFLVNNLHNNDIMMIKCSNSTKVNKLAKKLISFKR